MSHAASNASSWAAPGVEAAEVVDAAKIAEALASMLLSALGITVYILYYTNINAKLQNLGQDIVSKTQAGALGVVQHTQDQVKCLASQGVVNYTENSVKSAKNAAIRGTSSAVSGTVNLTQDVVSGASNVVTLATEMGVQTAKTNLDKTTVRTSPPAAAARRTPCVFAAVG